MKKTNFEISTKSSQNVSYRLRTLTLYTCPSIAYFVIIYVCLTSPKHLMCKSMLNYWYIHYTYLVKSHNIQIYLSSIDVSIGIFDTIASTFLSYLHIWEVKNINLRNFLRIWIIDVIPAKIVLYQLKLKFDWFASIL